MKRLELEMAMIESPRFDAATGVASDLDTLLKAAAGQPVSEIISASHDPKVQLLLAKRVLQLGAREFDLRYVNPADTAITVYLWILKMVNAPLAEAVAQDALGLRNGWWAPRFARRILSEPQATWTETVSVVHQSGGFGVAMVSSSREDYEISARGVAPHFLEARTLTGPIWLSSLAPTQAFTIGTAALTVVGASGAMDVMAEAA